MLQGTRRCHPIDKAQALSRPSNVAVCGTSPCAFASHLCRFTCAHCFYWTRKALSTLLIPPRTLCTRFIDTPSQPHQLMNACPKERQIIMRQCSSKSSYSATRQNRKGRKSSSTARPLCMLHGSCQTLYSRSSSRTLYTKSTFTSRGQHVVWRGSTPSQYAPYAMLQTSVH